MKKILFITTSSLASNPRLVKEFECIKRRCLCYVICFKHHDWSLKLSEDIKDRNPEVYFIEIDRRQNALETIKAKLLHKFSIVINPVFRKHFKVCAFASNDKTPQLSSRLEKLRKQHQFNKVIAHNLGAFYPALKLSKFQSIPLQLDIEDFYPGEGLYFNKTYEKANRNYIMQTSFTHAQTITYASKGIEIECKKLFKTQAQTNHITIINAFDSEDFMKPQKISDRKLRCIWFSQHIGPNRGLEQVFEAAKIHSTLEFHIIGNPNMVFLESIDLSDNIRIHEIMSQTQLHHFLSQMDIGLALESKDAGFNRNICLTNKFLAYAQAGLFILATDTFGQQDFLNTLDYNAGQLIDLNLATTLANFDTSVLSYENKIKRWEHAKAFSWEQEQCKLLQVLS